MHLWKKFLTWPTFNYIVSNFEKCQNMSNYFWKRTFIQNFKLPGSNSQQDICKCCLKTFNSFLKPLEGHFLQKLILSLRVSLRSTFTLDFKFFRPSSFRDMLMNVCQSVNYQSFSTFIDTLFRSKINTVKSCTKQGICSAFVWNMLLVCSMRRDSTIRQSHVEFGNQSHVTDGTKQLFWLTTPPRDFDSPQKISKMIRTFDCILLTITQCFISALQYI